ncbi:MAG: c-type cytochrome [bacterium]
MKKSVSIFAALIFATGLTHAAGDAAAGKEKSASCGGCHGVDGNSANPMWPSLAGQHASYIEKQLKNFKVGQRTDPTMAPMAMALSDQDMADVSAYYASQEIKGGASAADSVELGSAIYTGGNTKTGVSACTACHGPTGQGVPQAGFPAVAGQHAAYVAKTLNDFKTGARANDVNGMMQDIAAKMSKEEIEAVAQYIQGLN